MVRDCVRAWTHTQSKLVSAGVYRLHPWELKVPFEACLGMREGSNESAGCSIYMYRDVHAGLLLVFVQDVVNFLHGFVVTGVRAAQDDKYTDGVLINVLFDQLRVQSIAGLGTDGQDASLNLEISSELFQRHLSIGTHQDVGLACILSLFSALLLPASLHGQAAEMDGFRGTSGG